MDMQECLEIIKVLEERLSKIERVLREFLNVDLIDEYLIEK